MAGNADPIAALLGYGMPGIIIAILLIVARALWNALEKERAEKTDTIKAYAAARERDVTEQTKVLAANTVAMDRSASTMEQVKTTLQRLSP